MTSSYLISARRSAVAPRNGGFAHLSPEALSQPVLDAVIRDAGVSADEVDELIVANSLGAGGNLARILALAAGWPTRIAGLSIDRQCVGGLDALILADAMIRSGQHQIVVAGGAESYSRRPLRLETFVDGREPRAYEQARFTPWPERDPDMAEAADTLARQLGIPRAEQDQWAIDSHASANAAAIQGAAGIVKVADIETDTFTRALSTRHCARAAVVSGDITAANMAVAADGAAFVVLASGQYVKSHGLRAVEFVAGRTLGDDPEMPGLAPVAAIRDVFEQADIPTEALTFVEIMEAFAVQAIACQRGANIPRHLVNAKGGALARGHPIGASGAILAVRLFHDLRQSGGIGLAAIAAAGGLGSAVILRSA